MVLEPPANQPWHTIGPRPYLAAALLSLGFVGLRLLLEPALQGQAPLIALLAAPLLTCWFCGFGPAMAATLLCALLGEVLFVEPRFQIVPGNLAEWVRLGIFLLYAVLFSWLIETRRNTLRHLLAERRQLVETRDRLAAREAMFHAVVDNIDPLAWMADASGAMTWYSKRWTDYTGLTPQQLLGEGWRAVHHPEHLARVEEKFRRHVSSGEPWEDTFPLRGRDGHYRWFLSRAFPLRGGDGAVLSWFGTHTDIDAQRHAQEALLEADRRKDEFIAVLAHELRNPLAPVRNAVEILKLAASAEPRVERARGVIERQVTHMARLLDDLLDVSRISRRKLALQMERCDLAAIVRDTTEDYRSSIEAAGLRLQLHLPAGPVLVDGDPVRLTQMLGNLLTNAERFNQARGSVEVSCESLPGEHAAVVCVRDTGVGIDAALLLRLFDPFAQGAQDMARSKGGLGLGLAVTRGLVELHGGSVTAESPGHGRGAVFKLRLPLAESREVRPAPPLLAQGRGQQRLRILVVEDNVDAASTLAELLQLAGHEVEVTHTGRAGVDCARQWRPHVVISDLGLPGELDGFGVAAALRADPALAGVHLVALSGYADEKTQGRCAEAGFHAHLAKPPEWAALERALARASG